MPKVQIPKERVLEAAMQLIIREGYEQVNIKTVAQELGRSTQTISWTFGNMGNFRNELITYAREYFNSKLVPVGTNPVAGFASVGQLYLSQAYEEPNLLRFIHANSGKVAKEGGIGFVFDEEKNRALKDEIMKFTGMNEENTLRFMTSVVVYTKGLVGFILDGTLSYEQETAMQMLKETGIVYMVYGGVSEKTATEYFS